jgi:hypothetical protein
MDIQTLTAFFMWSTVINGGLLLFWISVTMLAPELVYRTQNKFFPMPRPTFTVVFYSFIGLFKIFFLFFNLVPYLALLIID